MSLPYDLEIGPRRQDTVLGTTPYVERDAPTPAGTTPKFELDISYHAGKAVGVHQRCPDSVLTFFDRRGAGACGVPGQVNTDDLEEPVVASLHHPASPLDSSLRHRYSLCCRNEHWDWMGPAASQLQHFSGSK